MVGIVASRRCSLTIGQPRAYGRIGVWKGFSMSDMVTIREDDLIESVADALQYISFYHPVDYIRALGEAYGAERLAKQLDDLHREFVNDHDMLKIDPAAGTVTVSPIFSWSSAGFIAAYDPGATGPYAERSPIERAILAFITPHVLPLEREVLQKNAFKVTYHPFDWSLNDLTGR